MNRLRYSTQFTGIRRKFFQSLEEFSVMVFIVIHSEIMKIKLPFKGSWKISVPVFLFSLLSWNISPAQISVTYETMSAGSYIVDMGVVPQTIGNGLKPYGMIYALISNQQVPVKWVINPNKAKDGTDFTYAGSNFRGGPFIIPAEYRNTVVNNVIASWVAQGVTGVTTTSPVTVPVYVTITSTFKVTLDYQNGAIAQSYMVNAGFPATSYYFKPVAQLNCCDDVFAMPHADPTWATHNRLYLWNQAYTLGGCEGGIFGGCHAMSVLENMYNPSNTSQQTNFLMLNNNGYGTAAVPYWSHVQGSPPYNYKHPADPIMQFMGTIDAAVLNGSEQIYLPQLTWRPESRMGVYDPSQANIPGLSNDTAAVIAYGNGFGNSGNGTILYIGSHSLAKATLPPNIAGQRAFLNFLFMSSLRHAMTLNYTIPATFTNGVAIPVSVAAGPAHNAPFTYQWVAVGITGTFANANAASTTFTANQPSGTSSGYITCIVTDACARKAFAKKDVVAKSGAQLPVAVSDNATISTTCYVPGQNVTLYPLSNDYDPEGYTLNVTAIGTGTGGTWVLNPDKSVVFTPSANFFGTATNSYTLCNNAPTPACITGTMTVGVGSPGAHGCYPGTIWDVANYDTIQNTSGSVSITNPDNVKGDPDYISGDATTYAVIDNNSDALIMDFGSASTAFDTLGIYFASATAGSSVTISVDYSNSSASGPWTNIGTLSTSTNTIFKGYLDYPAAGARWLRVMRTAGTINVWVDAALRENWDCVSAQVVANNDFAVMSEDIPITLSVLSNDINPGGLPLTMTITQSPSIGKLSINTNNTITYANNTDVSGSDVFKYKICNTQNYCSEGTVNITITDDNCTAGQYAPPNISAPVTKSFSLADSTDDAMLNQSNATTNYGSATTTEIGKRPNNVKRFIWKTIGYTTLIPSNATIQSATFRITQTAGDKGTMSYSLYRMTQSWTELQTTWNIRSTGVNWTPSAGGTFDPAIINTQSVSRTGASSNGTFTTFNVTALVQYWQANRGAASPRPDEMGLIIKQTVETNRDKRIIFGTSDNSTANNRPRLTVTYVTPLPCTAIPNRKPLANPDTASTYSNTAKTVLVLNNDSDPDGNSLTITSLIGTITGGTAQIISGSSILFTPSGTYSGSSTFQYVIQDNGTGNLTDTSSVTVTIRNTLPNAVKDVKTVNPNSSNNTITVQSNDNDPDGLAPLITNITSNPRHGTATVSGTNILYTPYPNYTGKDTLIYQACETPDPNNCSAAARCDTALVVITVNNTAPTANNDTRTILPCNTVVIDILGNDSDPENGQLTVTITQPPATGTYVLNPNGSVTYTPANNSPTPVTFQYTVTDNGSPPLTSAPATVTINISSPPSNTAPVAVRDDWTMVWNTSDAIPIMDNDYDPDGQNLTGLTITSSPHYGTASVLLSGSIEYTPNANYNGKDTLIYRIYDLLTTDPATCTQGPGLPDTAIVIITIYKPNSPPVANDDNFTFPANTTSTGYIYFNDSDPDNDQLTFSLIDGGTAAQNGNLTVNPDGSFNYTPNTGFTGNVSFYYQVCDNGSPSLCNYATVYITIVPITISGNVYDDANGLNDATVNGTGIDSTGVLPLYAYLISGSSVYEKVTVSPSGAFAFATGQQNTNYTVVISTSNVSVGSPTPSPNLPSGWAAVGEAFGTNNGAGSGNEGGTPNLSIAVNTGSNNVSGVNFGIDQIPVATDDTYTTLVSTPVSGNVLINDNDGEGSNLTVTLVSGPGTGSLVLNSDGTFTYTPTGTAGTVTFTYDACDPAGKCDTATVTIVVASCKTPTTAPGSIQR